ncbi:polysaccharide deacetylase family protein [Methylovirgula sp. HY1]|uniref:polysaccharide deacetylase family protein n=1 Tax=Methylovirgula sp. HY1 TaxID=2822761 RepID=UPI0021083BE3|nr:polysaccharide deacetylase family protein [Methylovirgula sp. HY1]
MAEVAALVDSKKFLISSGFSLFRLTGLHRLAIPVTRGLGVILMFHRVRPAEKRDFAPNRLLEITPEFFDAVLTRLTALGFAIVGLDEALARLQRGWPEGTQTRAPFAVLTFDDGTRDTKDFALPILEAHRAPFTTYVTTGFADRSARLWWVELEEAIRRLEKIDVEIDDEIIVLPARTATEKAAAFDALYRRLIAGPEERLLAVIGRLAATAGVVSAALVDDLCLDWAGIESLGRHPLCTVGVHTLTHARLAKYGEAVVRHELAESRRVIEAHIGKPARHLAYPVGDPSSAGRREFKIAEELGFASAVTTRPGMIFPQHRAHPTALPRLSINGNWQSLDMVEILLSGAPFALWNFGRKVV